MESILEDIVSQKRKDLENTKIITPPLMLYREVEAIMDTDVPRSFADALQKSETGIIAEFKRRSPSLGWIKEDGSPDVIPPAYEREGATALSILTEGPHFGGSSDFIRRARPLVSIPILRKDFIIDEYQVFEAKAIGADAILLIAACLDRKQCAMLARAASQLHLDVLLEVHEESELDYLCDGVTVVGVNNRNLHTFRSDINTSLHLAGLLPNDIVHISESGLSSPDHLRTLRQAGYKGFLMGERFMKTDDPGLALRNFIQSMS